MSAQSVFSRNTRFVFGIVAFVCVGCGGGEANKSGPLDLARHHARMLKDGDFETGWRPGEPPSHIVVPAKGKATDADLQKAQEQLAIEMKFVEYGAPYHLNALVMIGREATPVLLKMLRDDSPTPVFYTGERLDFERSGLQPYRPELLRRHQATMGDLADCALRRIYGTDVGWRSYLGPKERQEAYVKWQRVAAQEPPL